MKNSFQQSSAEKQSGLISAIKRLAGLGGTRRGSQSHSQGKGHRRLVLESLENRELLSVSVAELDQIHDINSNIGLSASMGTCNVVEFEADAVAQSSVSDSDLTSTSRDISADASLTPPVIFISQKDSANSALIFWSEVVFAEGYNLEYSNSPRFTNSETLYFDTAGDHVIDGLTPNTTYFFRIQAVDDGITSDWSSSIYVVTLSELAPPSFVSATVLGCTSIEFVLSPQEDAVSYTVQYCVKPESGQFDEAHQTTVDDPDSTFVVNNLEPATDYLFRFQAKAKQGLIDSKWSPVVEYTTSNQLTTPVIVDIKSDNISSATLSWNAVDLAKLYQVEYRTETGSWIVLPPLEQDKLSTTVSELESNTLYYFRVKALYNDSAQTEPVTTVLDSEYSDVQITKTQANTDVLLDNYCLTPVDSSVYIGSFTENDCKVFDLAPAADTNSNDMFTIVKVQKTADGSNPARDVYQLWTVGSLSKGDYTVEVRGAATSEELAKTTPQQLTIKAYRPEVIASSSVVFTSEDGGFSLSAYRTDMQDPNMRYEWMGDLNNPDSVVKEGQTVVINVSQDLRNIQAHQDEVGDTYKIIFLRGIDANGIASQGFEIRVYTSANVEHTGEKVDTSYLENPNICKINLSATGTAIATWVVSWGDNTESSVTVCGRKMTFVHYYQYPSSEPYSISYKLISIADTEYSGKIEDGFTVGASTPSVQGLPEEGPGMSDTDNSNQEPAIESMADVATVPDVEPVVDESVRVDTGSASARIVIAPKSVATPTVQPGQSMAVVLDEELTGSDSLLQDSDLDKLALGFIQQKYKTSTGLAGLTTSDQFFTTLEDKTLV